MRININFFYNLYISYFSLYALSLLYVLFILYVLISSTSLVADSNTKQRSIYISGYHASNSRLLNRHLEQSDKYHLDLIVDFKNADGIIFFKTNNILALKMGAVYPQKVDWFKIKTQNRLLFARWSYFLDKKFYHYHPECRLIKNAKTALFIDPNCEAFLSYNMNLLKELSSLPIDGIFLDYFRYPKGNDFGSQLELSSKLLTHLMSVREITNKKLGIFILASELWNTVGTKGVGQDWLQFESFLDYLIPMVYPELFAPGSFGYSRPKERPYDVVYNTFKRIAPSLYPKIIFGLQAYNYDYTQICAQINALNQEPIEKYYFWDPKNEYADVYDCLSSLSESQENITQ